jgi:hypothetical protein
MKIISGIYKIEDFKTGNVYVGSADQDNGIKKRWSNHLTHLRNGDHYYKELQEPYDIDKNRIKWEILKECGDDELQERENYWIHYCSLVDGWTVINKQKNAVRKSKVKDKSKMIKAQTGENNGHCTKLTKENVFQILDMVKKGIDREKIAAKFDIYPCYISRFGKDRWVKAYTEWKEKEIATSANVQPHDATAIAQNLFN